MATIICNGVCRYTVNGMAADRPFANIFDMRIDTTGSAVSRSDAIFQVAGDIINNYSDHISDLMSSDIIMNSLSWVDLDEADGEIGSRTETDAETWPMPGAIGVGVQSGGVSVLITKATRSARGHRNGRIFVPGIGSTLAGDNQLLPAQVGLWQQGANDFLNGINDGEGPNPVTRSLCVVHTPGINAVPPGATYVATSSDVDTLIVQPRLATQRRRTRA